MLFLLVCSNSCLRCTIPRILHKVPDSLSEVDGVWEQDRELKTTIIYTCNQELSIIMGLFGTVTIYMVPKSVITLQYLWEWPPYQISLPRFFMTTMKHQTKESDQVTKNGN